MNRDKLSHTNECQTPSEIPHNPTHGSFSLPVSVLASHSDTIDQLLAFAFDVLDLSSIALRVYEPGDEIEDDQ